jgi:hypothetical protein
MVRVCIENICNTRAHYNLKDEKIPIYCAKHKKINMIDIISRKCVENNCRIRPSFNFKCENKPIYCKIHKKEDMIDVINKRKYCKSTECNIIASFNYADKLNEAIYCFIHKKDGMINITNKRCLENNCMISPLYNYSNEHSGIYCDKHKKDGMINIVSNKCQEIGCNIQPIYNYVGQKKGHYCNRHKKENMVNIKKRKCLEDNCNIIPVFGFKNDGITQYCSKHKKAGMVDIISPKCIELECLSYASYANNNKKKALYCAIHKKDDMIDIRHNRCKTQLCNLIISNNKYKGYCLRCFIYIFPDKSNSRNYKTKERYVVEYIEKEFNDKTIIVDKRIQDGCSKKRPDLLIDLGYQVIIIEVDENQHQSYDYSCENKRIMELSQDVGHRPIIFIRFNPDDYVDKDNNKITSCWSINNKGICIVKKTKLKEWDTRLNILKDSIDYWCNNNTNKTVEIVQLFYDLSTWI